MTLTEIISKGLKGWHGVKLNQPDWSDDSHSIALSVTLANDVLHVYLIFNAYWDPLNFDLPVLEAGRQDLWQRWIDTSLESPHDITEWQEAPFITGYTYLARPRSVIVLWATGK